MSVLLLPLPEVVEVGFQGKILLLERIRLSAMEAGRSERGQWIQRALARVLAARQLGRMQAREGLRRLREACGLCAAETGAEHEWLQSLPGRAVLPKRLGD